MKRDRLNDLPNEILLHILSFLMIKDVVKTSILSKRWKNLWKSLPDLKLHTNDSEFKRKPYLFSECVSGVVSSRSMGNHPLRTLDFDRPGCFQHKIFTKLIKHAMSNGLEKLNIVVPSNIGLPLSIFSCRSLTSIYISVSMYDVKKRTRLPKRLDLPSLKCMHLDFVGIQADDSGHAEPFSTCTELTDLYIDKCALVYPSSVPQEVEGILNITNATLSKLTIEHPLTHTKLRPELTFKFVISTPKLTSFTINGSPFRASSLPEGMKVELCLSQ